MANINFSTHFSGPKPDQGNKEKSGNSQPPSGAMNILFLGNMGGSKSRPSAIPIDRDDFEEIMAKLDIQIPIGEGTNKAFTIPIRELDDFHPDQLYDSLEVFQRLRQLRRQLNNPNTFQAAAEEIRGWLVESPQAEESVSKEDTSPTEEINTDIQPSGSLLDSILDAAPKVNTSRPQTSLVDQLITEVVRPYIVEAEDPNKDKYIQAVDSALTDQMRAILHDPRFQEIEAAWQGLYFLVRRLETDSKLKLFLLHSDKESIAQKLSELNSKQPDFQWSLIVGNSSFSANQPDLNVLSAIGNSAQLLNAPFLASGNSSFVGLTEFTDNIGPEEWPTELTHQQDWNTLRESDAARYIGLTAPRFIARYPYGKKSSPVDSFDFEELSPHPVHREYLWGNGAVLLAYMIGSAFSRDGWQLNPNEQNRIGGLPTHHYEDEYGDRVMKPCAEINLTSRGSDMILAQGLIPIFSVRDEDSVQAGKLASIATDRGLKGHWLKA